jgi:hypothetical protein
MAFVPEANRRGLCPRRDTIATSAAGLDYDDLIGAIVARAAGEAARLQASGENAGPACRAPVDQP